MTQLIVLGIIGLLVGWFDQGAEDHGGSSSVDRLVRAALLAIFLASTLPGSTWAEDDPPRHADFWFHICAWFGAVIMGYVAGGLLRWVREEAR